MPDNEGNLFWYPAIHDKYLADDEGIDKPLLFQSYIRYYLARLQSMFEWKNLPDTIPAKWLESYLLCDGWCVVIETNKGLIATNAGMGAYPNEYYIPTRVIVSNPYIDDNYSAGSEYIIDGEGKNAVLVRNDTYIQGLLPLLTKYCTKLVENDISMNIADIMARATVALSAADDQTKASAEKWLKDLIAGKIGIIGETPFLVANQNESLRSTPIANVAGTLTDLIEYHQYLKAGLYNELGLNANYNMKREAINSNESQLNDDMLSPLIDEMLKMRREAADEINSMFGTDITVDFNSSWKENEIEEDLALEAMENQNESIELANDTVGDEDRETFDNDTQDETQEGFIEDTSDETQEEIPEFDEDVIEAVAEEIIEKVEDIIEEKDGDTDV